MNGVTPVRHPPIDALTAELAKCRHVDGAGHSRPPTRREDAARDARLELAGLAVERVEAR